MKINYDLIGRTLIHPVQAAILKRFAEVPGKASPKEIGVELNERVVIVAYHVRLLAGLPSGKQRSPYAAKPLLREVDTKPRRGAIEHYYALTKEATTDARS